MSNKVQFSSFLSEKSTEKKTTHQEKEKRPKIDYLNLFSQPKHEIKETDFEEKSKKTIDDEVTSKQAEKEPSTPSEGLHTTIEQEEVVNKQEVNNETSNTDIKNENQNDIQNQESTKKTKIDFLDLLSQFELKREQDEPAKEPRDESSNKASDDHVISKQPEAERPNKEETNHEHMENQKIVNDLAEDIKGNILEYEVQHGHAHCKCPHVHENEAKEHDVNTPDEDEEDEDDHTGQCQHKHVYHNTPPPQKDRLEYEDLITDHGPRKRGKVLDDKVYELIKLNQLRKQHKEECRRVQKMKRKDYLDHGFEDGRANKTVIDKAGDVVVPKGVDTSKSKLNKYKYLYKELQKKYNVKMNMSEERVNEEVIAQRERIKLIKDRMLAKYNILNKKTLKKVKDYSIEKTEELAGFPVEWYKKNKDKVRTSKEIYDEEINEQVKKELEAERSSMQQSPKSRKKRSTKILIRKNNDTYVISAKYLNLFRRKNVKIYLNHEHIRKFRKRRHVADKMDDGFDSQNEFNGKDANEKYPEIDTENPIHLDSNDLDIRYDDTETDNITTQLRAEDIVNTDYVDPKDTQNNETNDHFESVDMDQSGLNAAMDSAQNDEANDQAASMPLIRSKRSTKILIRKNNDTYVISSKYLNLFRRKNVKIYLNHEHIRKFRKRRHVADKIDDGFDSQNEFNGNDINENNVEENQDSKSIKDDRDIVETVNDEENQKVLRQDIVSSKPIYLDNQDLEIRHADSESNEDGTEITENDILDTNYIDPREYDTHQLVSDELLPGINNLFEDVKDFETKLLGDFNIQNMENGNMDQQYINVAQKVQSKENYHHRQKRADEFVYVTRPKRGWKKYIKKKIAEIKQKYSTKFKDRIYEWTTKHKWETLPDEKDRTTPKLITKKFLNIKKIEQMI